jgi:hypothetical protein
VFVTFEGIDGSSRSRNVTSGSSPPIAGTLRSRTRSTPSPRAIPWYASDESR